MKFIGIVIAIVVALCIFTAMMVGGCTWVAVEVAEEMDRQNAPVQLNTTDQAVDQPANKDSEPADSGARIHVMGKAYQISETVTLVLTKVAVGQFQLMDYREAFTPADNVLVVHFIIHNNDKRKQLTVYDRHNKFSMSGYRLKIYDDVDNRIAPISQTAAGSLPDGHKVNPETTTEYIGAFDVPLPKTEYIEITMDLSMVEAAGSAIFRVPVAQIAGFTGPPVAQEPEPERTPDELAAIQKKREADAKARTARLAAAQEAETRRFAEERAADLAAQKVAQREKALVSARSRIRLTKQALDSNNAGTLQKKWLTEIVAEFPDSDEAKEAAELLKQIK